MKRYIFLLIAFFLTNSALATGLDFSSDLKKIASINTNPESGVIPISDANKNIKLRKSKKSSTRNTSEIVNSSGSNTPSNVASDVSQNNIKTKSVKTSSNNKICKTYEGVVFEQGEAGYSDCILKVKNDRQAIKNVP